MPNVDASVILEDAERMIAWDITQLELQQEQMARQAFSLALQELWEGWWWADLMESAQFLAAVLYAAGTAFNAGDTCYFPATQKFYQAMQATTGNAPALYTNPPGSYLTNYAYWAEARQEYGGGDYLVGTNDTGLLLGASVRNPTDGNYYSLYCFEPIITVAGAGVTGANQLYNQEGTYQGQPAYVSTDGNYTLTWSGSTGSPANAWMIFNNGTGTPLYASLSATATPDLATGWFSVDGSGNPNPGNNPVPTVVNPQIYDTPDNPACWGKLVPFVPTIALAGDVRAVGRENPANSPNGLHNFDLAPEGIRLPGWDRGVPWVWYRRPTPIITGDAFDPTVNYSAATNITY